MQVFIPFADLHETARVLDPKRLNKQLVETDQILRAILRLTIAPDGAVVPREPRGWVNHPAVRAWREAPYGLLIHSQALMQERYRRGLKHGHKSYDNMVAIINHAGVARWGATLPSWWGREDIHSSHRARLLDKDPEWYGQFGWTETPRSEAEGYVWPVERSLV